MLDEERYAVSCNNDIGWCSNSNECIHKDCFRNLINFLHDGSGRDIMTVAAFKDTPECVYAEKEK